MVVDPKDGHVTHGHFQEFSCVFGQFEFSKLPCHIQINLDTWGANEELDLLSDLVLHC